MTTPESTLTERYVQAVLRRLPADQRPDIERELRTSIADAIDTRVEGGTEPAAAERETLTELGDPARLAAGYTDRPLHLIGPELFLDYVRLVRFLLVLVVPLVAAVVAVVGALQAGATVGSVIGDVIGVAINTTVHIVFWTTLIFAIIERIPQLRWSRLRPWTPDDLPEAQTRPAAAGELVAGTVMTVLVWTLVLLSPTFRFETDAADKAIPFFSPWLWESGLVYVFIGLGAITLAVDYVKHYVRWNAVVAVLSGLVGLAGASLVVWVGAERRLLNPAFVTAAQWPAEVTTWVHRGLMIAGVLAIVVTVIQTIVSLVTRTWNRGDLGSLIQNSVRGLPGGPNR
jgi:HAAS domain-containing protein